MKIYSVLYRGATGGQPAAFVLCPEEERLKVRVDLRAGASIELALGWSGELNDRLVGFYRSNPIPQPQPQP